MSELVTGDNDFWQLSPQAAASHVTIGPTSWRITRINGVHPLDGQFGAYPKRVVPHGMSELLFEASNPDLSEIRTAENDPTALPPIRTFALLDAAKLTNLPDLLENSELNHRCLFVNKARDDLGAVGPWLAEIKPESRLLRQLFTRADGEGNSWDIEAAVFLRARVGIDTLWRHLRKFTQLRDSNGGTRYFRFWQADLLLDMLLHDRIGTLLSSAFLALGRPWQIVSVIGIDRDGDGFAINIPVISATEPTPVPMLDVPLEHLILGATQRRQVRDMARALHRDFPAELAAFSPQDLRAEVARSIYRMHAHQFSSNSLLYMLAAWEVFYGPLDQIFDPEGILQRDLRSPLREQRKFTRIKTRLCDLYEAGHLPRIQSAIIEGAS